ncbi:MAG: hypothetical protein JST90_09150 [Bacteroidetes bacterium]|nr:hypothetical protein [Bacteroidota bacterium]
MPRIKMLITALALLLGGAAMAQSDGHSESAPPVSGGTSTPMPAGYIPNNAPSNGVPPGAAAVTQPDPTISQEDNGPTRLRKNPKGVKPPRRHPTKAGSARRATAPERREAAGAAPAKVSGE